MINVVINGLGEDSISILVAIIGIVVTIVLSLRHKVCTFTMINSINLGLYAFNYMKKTIWIIFITGEILCLSISLRNEINNETLVNLMKFFAYLAMFFVLIPYPIFNVLKLKELCGKYYKKVVDTRTVIYFCAIFNIFYGMFVLNYSESLASNPKISKAWTGNNEQYNMNFDKALKSVLLIIFVYFGVYVIFWIFEDCIFNVNAEQYEKFEIRINKTGMLYKFSQHDKVFACDDAKGLLIINNEDRLRFNVPNGKGSYRVIESDSIYPLFIKYEDIEYIKDHRGREILFGDELN